MITEYQQNTLCPCLWQNFVKSWYISERILVTATSTIFVFIPEKKLIVKWNWRHMTNLTEITQTSKWRFLFAISVFHSTKLIITLNSDEIKPTPGVGIAVFYVFAILSHLIRNCEGSITLSRSNIIRCVITCVHDNNGQCDADESDENQKSDYYEDCEAFFHFWSIVSRRKCYWRLRLKAGFSSFL